MATDTRHPIEDYLRHLIAQVENVPLLADLAAADIGTPRATASIARAALAWYLDGTPDARATRLRDELADSDVLVRARVRLASYDVSEAADWTEASKRLSWPQLQARRREVGVAA